VKAFVLREPGSAEMLQLTTLPLPVVNDDEVLVEIKAIGINPIDVKTRMGIGLYPRLVGDRPIILGWDISGIVVETGAGVSKFKKGDEVFGMIHFPGHGKAYAEYVACKADHLAVKPSNISHAAAAASCLAALTAWQALTKIASIKKKRPIARSCSCRRRWALCYSNCQISGGIHHWNLFGGQQRFCVVGRCTQGHRLPGSGF